MLPILMIWISRAGGSVSGLKPEKRNQLNQPKRSAHEGCRNEGKQAVEYADKQKNEHNGLNDSFVTHDAEIKFDGKKNKRNARAVKRRDRQQIEDREACVQNAEIL